MDNPLYLLLARRIVDTSVGPVEGDDTPTMPDEGDADSGKQTAERDP